MGYKYIITGMITATFDTHFFVKKLIKDGFPEKQAESIVELVRDVYKYDYIAATKGDIRESGLRLKNDMSAKKN